MAKGRKKIFIAMSGGVDSSVAALLLKKQGYDVLGVFMRCWTSPSPRINADIGITADSRGTLSECEQERDAEDARRVAEKIGIPFYVWDFEEEYKKRVVAYMIDGYRRGITPNPDVMCNKEIKFGLFLRKALELGADHVATGHYVCLRKTKNPTLGGIFVESRDNPRNSRLTLKAYSLYQAKDSSKDQSYFLWTLTQEQLKHCLFPIGDYLKSEVREMARKAGLPTAEKKDSQGICFLGRVTLKDFLGQYIPKKRGEVLDVRGRKIGEHRGAQFYTIGQRHLGIRNLELGIRGREIKPVYVAEKNMRTNRIVVVEGDENPALYRREIKLTSVNFIDQRPTTKNKQRVWARIRYRQPLSPANLICRGPSVVGCKLLFEKPQKAVAPGQSAVFYGQDGEVLGGGVIATTI